MPVSEALLERVKSYVRAGSGDEVLLTSLISAAKQYLSNAGVVEPEGEDHWYDGEILPEEDGELSLYELAVCLYVNTVYNGGKETLLDQALTGIILQIKEYGS